MSPRLIAREDEEISEAIREIHIGEGIGVRTGAECMERVDEMRHHIFMSIYSI